MMEKNGADAEQTIYGFEITDCELELVVFN
jgi:hypothetical protein